MNFLERCRHRLDVLCGTTASDSGPPNGILLGLMWLGLFAIAYLFGGSNAKFIYVDF